MASRPSLVSNTETSIVKFEKGSNMKEQGGTNYGSLATGSPAGFDNEFSTVRPDWITYRDELFTTCPAPEAIAAGESIAYQAALLGAC